MWPSVKAKAGQVAGHALRRKHVKAHVWAFLWHSLQTLLAIVYSIPSR